MPKISHICINCNKEFLAYKKEFRKYCSKDCKYSSGHTKEAKQKMREAKLKNPTNYWLGKKLSPEHNRKLQEGKENSKYPHNWRGGVNPINDTIRKSIEMRLWREAVFARDNWTCKKCDKKGEKIHPHHIKAFAYYPKLRFAIDNGITFCVKCHRKFHKKYGIKNINQKQLTEFLK